MKQVIVFGYNEYAKEIIHNFEIENMPIMVYVTEEKKLKEVREDGYKSELVELDDDWLDIGNQYKIEDLVCFCVLDNDAQNVFLTISLRAEYEKLHIIAIATSKDSADKLRLAGANKAIAKLETTANVIVESLEEPAIVEVMTEILSHNKELRLAEFKISETSVLANKNLHDITLHKAFHVIILAISDKSREEDYTFAAQGHNHILDVDDILIVIGKDRDLVAFEKEIK